MSLVLTSAALDALACARLVRLVQEDSLLDVARDRLLDVLHERGYVRAEELLACRWCLSMWCGFGVVAARALFPRQWDVLAKALAFSMITGLIGEYSGQH